LTSNHKAASDCSVGDAAFGKTKEIIMQDEYFDIVNERNEIVGQEKRQVVHKTGLWHRGVHVFLFTPDRKLLIQKRSQTRDKFPGTLDCSVSEHLKPGESFFVGAIRGLREELGLEGIHLTRLVRFKMNYGPNDNEFSEVFEGTIDDGIQITVDPHEVDGVAFHTIHELEEMMGEDVSPIAPWFVQLLRWYTGEPAAMEILWERSAKD